MSGFKASPGGIKSFGDLVGLQADHAVACQRYISNHTELEGSEGWLNELTDSHDDIVGNTRGWFDELNRYTLEAAELAVLDSAEYYANTDAEAAEDLDTQLGEYRTNPPIVGDPTYYFTNRADHGTFGEILDPAGRLAAPDDYAAQGAWRWEPKWNDYLSVSSAGRGAFMAATEALTWIGWLDRVYDPYEFLLKPVTGDWAGFRACVDVFRNTADACRDIGGNLRHGTIGLPNVWTGNAADACVQFITAVGDVLPEAAQVLEAIADEYEVAAKGAFEFSSVVGSLISDLIDSMLIFVAAVGGGAATAATGIGAIIGGGIAAYEGYRIAEMINSLARAYSVTDNIMAKAKAGLYSFGWINEAGTSLPKTPQVSDEGSSLRDLPE